MPTTVTGGFNELIRRLELTDDQATTAESRVKGIKDFFDANFKMAERAFTIGSYRRGTLIRPERDVDLLAPFSVAEYWQTYRGDSRAFVYMIRDKLNRGYAKTDVSSKQVAVVLDFSVIRAEIVPGFRRDGGGYLIPDGSKSWMATNPPYHANLIRDRDTALGGKLKPLIRLMKFWNIANGHHLRSFHVELMVWRMWKEAESLAAYPNAVMQSLGAMRGWLASRFDDPWSSGGDIDRYLGTDDREKVRRMLAEDHKAGEDAEELRKAGKDEKAMEKWNSIFRKQFPAFG